jgi:CHASE1-domain containing sensor protein
MLDKEELEKRKKVTANLLEQLMDDFIQLGRSANISHFDAQDIKRMAFKDFDNREITEFTDMFTFIIKTTI